MADDAENAPEAMTDAADEAREAIGRAISAYLQIVRPGDSPLVVAWVVGAEWTNIELEQTGRAGRDVAMPRDQTISASGGLGAYIARRFE